METETLINVASRWLHVGSAIVLFGGTLFQYLVLMPAAKDLSPDERTALHGRVMGRWRKIVGATIGLLLLTGLYNYLVVTAPAHRELPSRSQYHMLMGIKILLSLAVFFVASALVGRSAKFEGMRSQARKWMTVTICLAAAIVAIAGYLKVALPTGSVADRSTATSAD
jgi:uncharacterized membrane protein